MTSERYPRVIHCLKRVYLRPQRTVIKTSVTRQWFSKNWFLLIFHVFSGAILPGSGPTVAEAFDCPSTTGCGHCQNQNMCNWCNNYGWYKINNVITLTWRVSDHYYTNTTHIQTTCLKIKLMQNVWLAFWTNLSQIINCSMKHDRWLHRECFRKKPWIALIRNCLFQYHAEGFQLYVCLYKFHWNNDYFI